MFTIKQAAILTILKFFQSKKIKVKKIICVDFWPDYKRKLISTDEGYAKDQRKQKKPKEITK